jgi:hypothetical protein
MSSHFARAAGSETRAFRKSAGTVWTTPVESFSLTPLPYTRCPGVLSAVGKSPDTLPPLPGLSESPEGGESNSSARLCWMWDTTNPGLSSGPETSVEPVVQHHVPCQGTTYSRAEKTQIIRALLSLILRQWPRWTLACRGYEQAALPLDAQADSLGTT